MKKYISRIAICCMFAMIVMLCGTFVFRFVHPMEEAVYDLSTLAEDGQNYAEDKGWTVFTEENGIQTVLVPNDIGGFSGLSHPGQTFYFSRILAEELDAPTLRIGVVDRSVAVFLNDEQIYSDCPEQTGGIGTLQLPMLEYDHRADPVVLSLPAGYEGKTLTIAQSTSADGGEKQSFDDTVYPCEVALYCGYAYESALIAESWQTASPASVLFTLGMVLLCAFCIGLFRRREDGTWRQNIDIGLLSIAAATLLTTLSMSYSADYLWRYGGTTVDVVSICRLLSLCTLLMFLASRAKKYRAVFWCLTGIYAASCAVACGLQLFSPVIASDTDLLLRLTLPQTTGFLALLAAAVMGTLLWRRESLFYQLYSDCIVLGIAAYLITIVLSLLFVAEWGAKAQMQLSLALQSGFAYILWRLMLLSIASAMLAVMVTQAQQFTVSRAERKLLSQRMQLAQDSYESMCERNEEIMKLRHDMTNHFKTLRGMTEEPSVSAYLDELLGQNEKIHPVVQSGNEMLDILLNGEIAAASKAGIHSEVVKAEAPPQISLTDAELSSVILNIMDNAVKAAASADPSKKYLRIKAQCKNDFFVFSCENATSPLTEPQKPATEHGLGLKIIRQIADRRNGVFTIEQQNNRFKVIFAVPLQPIK